jgi:phospholipase C
MRNKKTRYNLLSTVAMLAVATGVAWSGPVAAGDLLGFISELGLAHTPANDAMTATPIKHLVVIFQENRSFDHYFGTYPSALNPEGEPAFKAAKNTPAANNFQANPSLLFDNPNLNPANGSSAVNPFRLDRTQANTSDQNHGYTPEQSAFDNGKLDLFPADVGSGTAGGAGAFGTTGQVMGYFDGNTVTAFWNYAQNFAMSDNAYTDTFGPSTPGALEMFSGQTNGATFPVLPAGITSANIAALLEEADAGVADGQGGFTLTGDIDPLGDVCSGQPQVEMTAQNVGDLLNTANLPWGSFVGGFNLQTVNANGSTGCWRSTVSPFSGGTHGDYTPHHIWFQYFASTANPTHARPSSTAAIGLTKDPKTQTADPANHAYDLNDFTAAVQAGNYPSVSFIKMASFQDAHPGNSDPLDEQAGVVNLINFLQQQPDWKATAVIIAYDDSDGWYDHAFVQPTNRASFSVLDTLNGNGICGPGGTEPNGLNNLPVAGRCGPGTRTPFLVISPFAKTNFIDHTLITQASITRFIEDNWLQGKRLGGGSFDATTGSIMNMFNFNQLVLNFDERMLVLDPTTGTVVSSKPKL